MIRLAILAAFAAVLCGSAVAEDLYEPVQQASLRADLPFTRALGAAGVVSGSLAQSAVAAGVPAPALADMLQAFATAVDLDRDVHDGDRFYVRYERTFSLDNTPLDGGRVLWAELWPAGRKASIIIHRFQPQGAAHDSFWLANGQGTTPALLRLPVDTVIVSSGFGLRVDPLDQLPRAFASVHGPVAGGGKGPTHAPFLPPGLLSTPGKALTSVNRPTPLGMSLGLAPTVPIARSALAGHGLGALELHEGVDLVAPYGSDIHAAGDGIVRGAEPKGRYGNWIEIDHEADLSTVYGHLASFAPGIAPGTPVARGDVIGYVGLTGRTTGPHVHFEVRFKDRPVNPMVYSALKRPQLRGGDLDRFRKLVAADLAERDREFKVASTGL